MALPAGPTARRACLVSISLAPGGPPVATEAPLFYICWSADHSCQASWLQGDMPTLTTVGSLLILLALARLGAASTPIHLDAPQILDEAPFCDRAFAVLRRCASDLDVVESKCCGLVKAFQGQGCAW